MRLQNLSDALPGRVHLTLPLSWQKRRLKVPSIVALHHAEIPEGERAWAGAVPVTKPARAIHDCAAGHVAPELAAQAIEQGLAIKARAPRPGSYGASCCSWGCAA